MSSILFIKAVVGSLLLPPGNGLLLLALAGIFRRRRWAFAVALIGAGALGLQSLPLVSGSLLRSLEARAGSPPPSPAGAQAIVILGSGLVRNAPEYGDDTANERTLIRVRYGAQLARRWQLPVLVTGGRPADAKLSEAAVMATILAKEFAVPVRWQEDQASDTADNARNSANILRVAGIQRIVLVTQAFHMPRALRLFRAAGLEVVPAPTDFRGGAGEQPPGIFDLIPQASALHHSYYALHEWLGIGWAALSGH